MKNAKRRTGFVALAAGFVAAGCAHVAETAEETVAATSDAVAAETAQVANAARLEVILETQDDATKARYGDRHPQETIAFFGIEPGMTVAEALPGGGWYSKILLPYLGDNGRLIGMDYSVDMWSKFGGFANEDFLEARADWSDTWMQTAVEENWHAHTMSDLGAFAFGSRDTSLDGTADVVLLVRAMHHLNRFNTDEQNYMTEALADVHALLKPGGVLGVVQHRGPEEHSDEWAVGNNGYLKQSDVIAWVEAAGFELVEASEINANTRDVPTEDDFVWRLPPSLRTSRDNPELRAEMEAIGETDRMTLKFRKL